MFVYISLFLSLFTRRVAQVDRQHPKAFLRLWDGSTLQTSLPFAANARQRSSRKSGLTRIWRPAGAMNKCAAMP